jgi:hypothetical protein
MAPAGDATARRRERSATATIGGGTGSPSADRERNRNNQLQARKQQKRDNRSHCTSGWSRTMQAEIPIQIAGAIVAIGLYFLPSIVADRRHRHDALVIALFNALFAWTGFGWLLALYWACQPNPSPNVVGEIRANRHGVSMRIFSAGLVERVQRRIAAQQR